MDTAKQHATEEYSLFRSKKKSGEEDKNSDDRLFYSIAIIQKVVEELESTHETMSRILKSLEENFKSPARNCPFLPKRLHPK